MQQQIFIVGKTQYGCEGWSYKEVLPHFQALERFSEGSEASEVSTARGKEGLIGVAPLFPPLPEVEDFTKACESHADANRIKDYNAGYLAGVSPVQLSTGGTAGGRQDCFSTLVEPLLKHYPNLQWSVRPFVARCFWNPTSKREVLNWTAKWWSATDFVSKGSGSECWCSTYSTTLDAVRYWWRGTFEGQGSKKSGGNLRTFFME